MFSMPFWVRRNKDTYAGIEGGSFLVGPGRQKERFLGAFKEAPASRSVDGPLLSMWARVYRSGLGYPKGKRTEVRSNASRPRLGHCCQDNIQRMRSTHFR